jgi:hypothetical protein
VGPQEPLWLVLPRLLGLGRVEPVEAAVLDFAKDREQFARQYQALLRDQLQQQLLLPRLARLLLVELEALLAVVAVVAEDPLRSKEQPHRTVDFAVGLLRLCC